MRESSSVQDLLSGESLFSESCTGDCVALTSVWTDRAFDYVMKNASEPLELVKSYAHYASEIQSKSASPSEVTQWDAQGNPILSKSPAKSVPSSGRIQIDPAKGERVSKSPPKSVPSSGR
jgi:hypothetical protein